MEFDIIIGNPPYSIGQGSVILYPKIIISANQILPKYQTYIIPVGWLHSNNNIYKAFRQKLFEYGLKKVIFLDDPFDGHIGSEIGICQIICEQHYRGDIELLDEKTQQTINYDFRSLGYIIQTFDLQELEYLIGCLDNSFKMQFKSTNSSTMAYVRPYLVSSIDPAQEYQYYKIYCRKNNNPSYQYLNKADIQKYNIVIDTKDSDKIRLVTSVFPSGKANWRALHIEIIPGDGTILMLSHRYRIALCINSAEKEAKYLMSEKITNILTKTRTCRTLGISILRFIPRIDYLEQYLG